MYLYLFLKYPLMCGIILAAFFDAVKAKRMNNRDILISFFLIIIGLLIVMFVDDSFTTPVTNPQEFMQNTDVTVTVNNTVTSETSSETSMNTIENQNTAEEYKSDNIAEQFISKILFIFFIILTVLISISLFTFWIYLQVKQ